MRRKKYIYILISVALVLLIMGIPDLFASKDIDKEYKIEMGKIMTEEFGCVDCHSPKIIIKNQTIIDENKLFSGHPQDNVLPDFPPELVAPGKWTGLYISGTTAWGGPWGISYSANLTPDKETGIGTWNEEYFKRNIKLGIHSSQTRKIMPPMPWFELSRLNEDELGAIFLYLKSLKPIKNKVPESKPLQSHEDLANK